MELLETIVALVLFSTISVILLCITVLVTLDGLDEWRAHRERKVR